MKLAPAGRMLTPSLMSTYLRSCALLALVACATSGTSGPLTSSGGSGSPDAGASWSGDSDAPLPNLSEAGAAVIETPEQLMAVTGPKPTKPRQLTGVWLASDGPFPLRMLVRPDSVMLAGKCGSQVFGAPGVVQAGNDSFVLLEKLEATSGSGSSTYCKVSLPAGRISPYRTGEYDLTLTQLEVRNNSGLYTSSLSFTKIAD
jgi:hypothetical protein